MTRLVTALVVGGASVLEARVNAVAVAEAAASASGAEARGANDIMEGLVAPILSPPRRDFWLPPRRFPTAPLLCSAVPSLCPPRRILNRARQLGHGFKLGVHDRICLVAGPCWEGAD